VRLTSLPCKNSIFWKRRQQEGCGLKVGRNNVEEMWKIFICLGVWGAGVWVVIPKWQLIFLSVTVCDFIISLIFLYMHRVFIVYCNMACNLVPKFYVPHPSAAISCLYLL
jgi:hypothetical protein